MQRFLPLLIFLFTTQLGFSQSNFWQNTEEKNINLEADAHREIIPTDYRTIHLDKASLENFLSNAPKSNSLDVENPLQLAIPMPNGDDEIFDVIYDPVLPPNLAAKYPSIRCYMGRSLDRKKFIRFDVSPNGFHASVRTNEGTIFISPYAVKHVDHCISYYVKNHHSEFTHSCGTSSDMLPENSAAGMPMDLIEGPSVKSRSSFVGVVERREYKAAIACAGEWGSIFGGTLEGAFASVVSAANLLNSFFEPEHAIKFTLVENNDQLIFVNPANDPYVNIDDSSLMLDLNQTALNSTIGAAAYDIGHLFTMSPCVIYNNPNDDDDDFPIAGVAGGGVCGNNKGRGLTCFGNNGSITNAVVNTMTHEIAHQFSASHTWDNCPSALQQRASGSAYEPGSGTTIMSYSGTCQNQNIANNGQEYYHVESLDQIYTFAHLAGGAECGEDILNANNYPEIEWNYVDGFYIPLSTPFELDAIATDPDGDELTYCWEQYNTGPLSNIGTPSGNAPIFRSFAPRASSNRYFPNIGKIINNNFDNEEVLPTYARDLNFRMTARDNRMDGGGSVWEEVAFHVAANSGPFLVSHPNTDATLWNAGDFTTVEWDVANTDSAPVNCEFVNIRLSTDGGLTYPFMLVENTPNDGTEEVTVPNVTTGSARIRVEGAGNVFFDLSNENFDIQASPDTTFAVSVSPVYQELCLPTTTDLVFSTFGLNGFNTPVTASIVNELPANAVPTFTNNTAAPGSDINLNLDLTNVVSAGVFDIELMLVAGTDTAFRTVTMETLSNDFSSLALLSPAPGAAGTSGVSGTPTFDWVEVFDAQFYDIQIATSPAFGVDDIVDENYGFANAFYDASVLLDINTIHYWRVRPNNTCGNGEWTEIGAFHTEAFSCNTAVSDNVPQNIPFAGLPVIESTITILTDGVINDLNVSSIVGTHNLLKHLDVSLISPNGIEVLLFTDLCGNTTTFNFGLDDDAPFDIACPPLGGIIYKPQNSLNDFINQSTMGTWTLRMEVNDTNGDGGSLNGWSLDFCSNVALNPPFLVINEPLVTPPSATANIHNNLLLVEDANTGPDDLLYTIVDLPLYGSLLLDGNPIESGTQITQGTIDGFRFAYMQDGSNVSEDNFTFNVSDQEGGWLGILTFDIEIDPDAMVNTNDLENDNSIILFPNPTTNDFSILFDKAITGQLNVKVLNVQGQEVISNNYSQVNEIINIGGKELPSGIYFVKVTTESGIYSAKVTVQ